MYFSIWYNKNDFSSIKKAMSVYRQLRKGNVEKKEIFFNSWKKPALNFNCALKGSIILATWGEENNTPIHYKEVFDYFFVDVGYKGKYGLNARFKI